MSKILILTRSYPSHDDLYQYPFVHQRALAYRKLGHEILVFRAGSDGAAHTHAFEGVSCITGGPRAFEQRVRAWKPDVIAVHGFSEQLWDVLGSVAGSIPVNAWLHGSEIPDFMRRKAEVAPEDQRASAFDQLEKRRAFWSHFLDNAPRLFRLVFVSHASVDMARRDWGTKIDNVDHAVVPNPIDTDLFRYLPKVADDRYKVLLIRPFDSHTYANDMAVDALLDVLRRPGSDKMQVTIIGDGPLFDVTLAPLRGHPSVAIRRQFLPQQEIPQEHAKHGLFLVPTRLDTQGLSRDEAMSSGLVPVTNAIPAVMEFVDESCCAVAPPDDPEALANQLWAMIQDPELFLIRSANAATRIRNQRSNSLIIPRELELLAPA